MVARRERDHIVDCDSMRAPNDLRWYDPVYFLINIESQLKWSPLVRKDTLSKLWELVLAGLPGGRPARLYGPSADRRGLFSVARAVSSRRNDPRAFV